MRNLSVDEAKAVNRLAINRSTANTEGMAWREEVRVQLVRVLAARTVAEDATVVGWWHGTCTAVNDTTT